MPSFTGSNSTKLLLLTTIKKTGGWKPLPTGFYFLPKFKSKAEA
jgi:hypothetical protein